MTHSFDVSIAEKHGVNAAIVINLVRGWIAYNKANHKNEKNGHTWTFNSVKSWAKLVPYLTAKQVRSALDELVAGEFLIKANLNENQYDQTLWYALADESVEACPTGQIQLPHRANGEALQGKSLEQGIKPIDITQAKLNEVKGEAEKFVGWFIELLKKTGAPPLRLTPSNQQGWRDAYEKLRRIDGKEKDEIKFVCEWTRGDGFWKKNFFSPIKLRDRKDGITFYDLMLCKSKNEDAPFSNNGHAVRSEPIAASNLR